MVLSGRVSYGDGVVALILLLRPLDYEAAQGLPRLHADPSLGLGHHLPHRLRERERETEMQNKETVEENGVA